MNKEQLDYIESNIDNAESIGALSFGWADNVRELVREMRKDKRVLSTIADVLSVTKSLKDLQAENACSRAEVERLKHEIEVAKRLDDFRLLEIANLRLRLAQANAALGIVDPALGTGAFLAGLENPPYDEKGGDK